MTALVKMRSNKMRALMIVAAVLFAPAVSAKAMAAAVDATSAAGSNSPTVYYAVAETEIELLIDDPAAKAIIDRHIPGLTSSEQVGLIGGLTLKDLQQYLPTVVTDAKLAAIQADFRKM